MQNFKIFRELYPGPRTEGARGRFVPPAPRSKTYSYDMSRNVGNRSMAMLILHNPRITLITVAVYFRV
jgi:hypothetical protein